MTFARKRHLRARDICAQEMCLPPRGASPSNGSASIVKCCVLPTILELLCQGEEAAKAAVTQGLV